MQEVDITLLKKRAIRGVVALSTRTLLLQIVAFVATFVLTIFLEPAMFGVFYIVSAVISFLGYFSDIGLAAALVQKRDDPTQRDLSTAFIIQQVLVGSLCLLSLVFSDHIASFYAFDLSGLWLFRALVLSFFLSSLKTIPSILLERALDFNSLVIPQLIETIVFYGVAVFLAWQGQGVTSFTWAVILRGFSGLIAIYFIRPWKISISFSRTSASELMHFGLPFQVNSILALLKDDLLTLVLGKILAPASIGYIGWAKKWSEVPLRLILDSVVRVTFPTFSRIQHDRSALAAALQKILFGIVSVIAPITITMIFFIHPLVSIIPKYEKWYPALFSFVLFSISSFVASINTPLTNILNAIGKVKTTLSLMVIWTVFTWIGTLVFVKFFGFNGVSITHVIVGFSVFWVVSVTKKVVPFSISKSILAPSLASIALIILYTVIFYYSPPATILTLIIMSIGGLMIYIGILTIIAKESVTSLLQDIRHRDLP